MNYAKDIIQQSIKDLRLDQSRARRRYIEKLINYYTGTDTDMYISTYFDAKSYQEVPIYTMNITKKFIDKKSRIYTLAPDRKVGGKGITKKYNDLIHNKNLKMKHIERMTNLLGTIALYVYWDECEDGSHLNYRPIYYFDAFFDEDPTKPIAISYPMLEPTGDTSYVSEDLKFCYWDADYKIIYDERGNVVSETRHGLGVLPFVFPRKDEQIDDFFSEGSSDVVGANEQINITLTELQLGLRFQMFGQPWASGVYEDEPISRMGSDTIINLPVDGRFGIESPQGDIAKVIESIKFQLELLAQSKHMHITFDSNMDRPSSGLALIIKDFDRIEDYHDTVESWRLFEHQLYRLERLILSKNGIELPKDLNVEFLEPEYPKSVNEKIQLWNWMLERGHTSDAEILSKNKKDITVDEAKKIIEKNQAEMPEEKEEDAKKDNIFNS